MPPAKILRDHNYAKPENKIHVPPNKQDPEITNKKLKSKMKNLQQQKDYKNGRHYEQFTTKLNYSIKSEVADELHTTFDKLKLSIFYNTKNNTKWHCEKVIQKGRTSDRSKISEYSHTILIIILGS